MESAVRRTVVISDKDPLGLHLRPAQLLSQLAARFQSDIEVVRDALRVDAKSILNVMTLAAAPGVELVIEARGVDAQEAVDKLAKFFENGFVVEDTPGQKTGGNAGPAKPKSHGSGKRFNKAPGPTGRQRDTASE